MPVFDPTDAVLRAARAPTTGSSTSFGENFSAAFDEFFAGQRSVSILDQRTEEAQRIRDTLVERGAKASRLGDPVEVGQRPGEGPIDREAALEQFFDRAREATADQPELADDLPMSIEELDEQVGANIRELEEESADVAFRAGTSGVVGNFLGGMAGATADPPVLASMLFGASAASGILRTAAVEAGIGGAIEVPIQAAVQTQRVGLGLDGGLERGIQNIAMVAAGSGVLGGGIRAVARGVSSARRTIRQRREADTARNIPPERVQVDEDLKGAVNTTIRTQEIRDRNPFVDVPSANRQFQETFDDLLRNVQQRGEIPNRSSGLPLREDVARTSLTDTDVRASLVSAASRGVGRVSGPREASNVSEVGAALGQLLRERADARSADPAVQRGQAARAISEEISASGRPGEVLDTLRVGAELEQVARRARSEADGDDFAALEAFRPEFERRFPDADEDAASDFLTGRHELSQAVRALEEVAPSFRALNDAAPSARQGEDTLAELRQTLTSVEEAAASGRSRADIEQERAATAAILENQADAVASLRQSVEDDIPGDAPLRIVDDDGSIRSTTARAVLDDLDGDEALVRETQACLRGGAI